MNIRLLVGYAAGVALLGVSLAAQAGSVRLLSQERCVTADAAAGIDGRHDSRENSSNWVDGTRFAIALPGARKAAAILGRP